jgi:Protein of unknown function (DUF2786)
LVTS